MFDQQQTERFDAEIAVSEKTRAEMKRIAAIRGAGGVSPPSFRRRIRNERYYQRKANGICTYGSVENCPHPPAEDSTLCASHLEDANDRKARSAQALRDERREDGWCAYCGKVKSETYACAGCAVRRGDIPTVHSDNTVDNALLGVSRSGHERRGDVSSWREETHNGKTSLRYVGQSKRGSPSKAAEDERDLTQIRAEIDRAQAGLVFARTIEDKAQRKAAIRAALSRLALAVRFADDVFDRHDYEP